MCWRKRRGETEFYDSNGQNVVLWRRWWSIREGVLTRLGWSQQTCTPTPLWKTAASPWGQRRGGRKVRQELIRANPQPSNFRCPCDSRPSNRTHRSRVDVFLLLAFLFGIQNLDNKHGEDKMFFCCLVFFPANAAELWTRTVGRLLIMHCPQIRAGIHNSGENCFNELCTDVGEVTRKTLFFNDQAHK